MEALLSQFALLSSQACQDKNFDPSSIDDLLKLFEIEAYKSWAEMECEQVKEVKQAEVAMQQAEDYLDSVMEDAMDEFTRFEVELERMARNELGDLEKTAESARNMGNLMEKAAAIASTKYMEAALNSATASMKTASKGLSTKKTQNFRRISEIDIPIQTSNGLKFLRQLTFSNATFKGVIKHQFYLAVVLRTLLETEAWAMSNEQKLRLCKWPVCFTLVKFPTM
ncbi:MATERNAL EFFECT EMBRYO ARREST 9 [Salix viminalis]|uniref:MATERNAL EFFECT EMBRYO ARREST 9 n=1 Tax=Salix viminalis TaxID=40686 RepID=A0A9Q0ZP27_SALVM|nr:MATERNAL EFFECT EMBRYO ARREST 9 [Salix viminalis]